MDRLSVVSHSRFAFRIVTHSNRFSDYSKHERVLCFSHIQIFIESTNQSVVKASRKSVCFLCLKIWFKLAYQYVRLIDFSHLQSVRAHDYASTIQLLTEFIKKNVKKKSQFSTSDLSVILSLSLIHLVFASDKLTMCQSQLLSFLENIRRYIDLIANTHETNWAFA